MNSHKWARQVQQALWPGEEHVGLPVLLPGGEEGSLLGFEHEDDPVRLTYSLGFRGLRDTL